MKIILFERQTENYFSIIEIGKLHVWWNGGVGCWHIVNWSSGGHSFYLGKLNLEYE